MKRIPRSACALLVGALVLHLAPPSARADDAPPSDATPAPPATRKVVRKAAAVAPAPAAVLPSVKLTISPAPFPQPWTMRVENTGEVPLRLVADVRLLALDVARPGTGAKGSVRCVLPASMRPAGDRARGLVVPPQRAYAETFDPRLYCFGESAQAAMAAGAEVTARLGFPVAARASAAARLSGPFVLAPIDGVAPRVSAVKEILAAPVILDATTALAAQATASAAEAPPAAFGLEMTRWKDAASGSELDVRVTLTNNSPSAVRVRLRPAALAFDISGPSGTTRCDWDGNPGPPARELMSTLPPRSAMSTSVLLSALCPDGAFDDAGIYAVRVALDASRLTGEGAAAPEALPAKNLAFVRVQRARQPEGEARPKLQAP